MGEETGVIADSSTTPRISRNEGCVPAGGLKMTAEVLIAGLITVVRPFIDLRQRDVLCGRNTRQLTIVTAYRLMGATVTIIQPVQHALPAERTAYHACRPFTLPV